jgi:hypothetical protein
MRCGHSEGRRYLAKDDQGEGSSPHAAHCQGSQGDPSPAPIMLYCPECKRRKEAPIDVTDPPGTAIVEALCTECDSGGFKPETRYYDSEGRWFDGEKFRATRHRESGPGGSLPR